MDELLALLGRGWQPLLVYPGVFTGLLLTLLVGAVWRPDTTRTRGLPRWRAWESGTVQQAGSALLLLALLPLPRVSWPYTLDAIGALLLLEVPLWLQLRRLLRSADSGVYEPAACTAASLLNVYPLLLLAVAALAQSASSLLLPALKTGQPQLRWAGLVVWGTALPPLLALGPWRMCGLDTWPSQLRRVGHTGLLLSVALPPGDRWGHAATATGALIAFGSLTLLHYTWRGSPEWWERWQPAIALLLLLLLLRWNVGAWLARLR